MRWVLLGLLGALAGGCANRNSISDVRIVNAPLMTGTDRYTTCDKCGARSECGSASNSTLWATDHYKKTGHEAFTRHGCRAATDLGLGVRGPQGHDVSLDELRRDADHRLTQGMLYNQACFVMGQSGVVEQETDKVKTVRFRQSVTDGARTSWRDLWAEFDPATSTLVRVQYGVWKDGTR